MMEAKKEVVKPSVWNLLERKIAPLWVNDDQEDVILAKIQKEEAEEREMAKAKPLYQIGNMTDVCQMLIEKHVEPQLDYQAEKTTKKNKQEKEEELQQDTGLKKLIFVEMEEFPGLYDTPSPLPQKIETPSIMKLVTEAIKIYEKPGLLREWQEFFFSRESQDILHDLFWWFFLKKFQKPPPESYSYVYERELSDKTSSLFARVAKTYTMLLNKTFRYSNREKLLLQYPNAISQSIYSAYCHAFPVSWRRYDKEFKNDVLTTVSLWMTGTRPMIRHWLNWDYSKLEPHNMRKDSIDKDANSQKQKVRDKSIDSLLFPSTSSAGKISPSVQEKRDKHSDRLSHKDNSHTSLNSSKSHVTLPKHANEPSKRNLSHHGSISPPVRTHSVNKRSHPAPRNRGRKLESHPAEPGPEFVLTKFDSSGHSPLVEFSLRKQHLARDVGMSKLLTRKEISSYPSLEGQTYRQLIGESRRKVKEISKDVNKYWQDCRRTHIRHTVEHQQIRSDFQQKSNKLLESPNIVSKLAEMIVMDRVHGSAGTAAKISSTIDNLISQQEEIEEKAE